MSAAPRPLLLAVDNDTEALARIERELCRRYESDYRIVCVPSAEAAVSALERAADDGEAVALVLAEQWLGELTGEELLGRTRQAHPRAKRALLIEWGGWGDPRTAEAIVRAMALGHIDYYALKPTRSPDELFNRTVAEYLHEWGRSAASDVAEVTLVGERRLPRVHELRDLLTRTGVPHAFCEADTDEGRAILERAGQSGVSSPVVTLWDGRVLVNPSNSEMASAYGIQTELAAGTKVDVAVVGAGPAGLAAAVYASSEGLSTLVVERESIGGQAGTTSLIRNYLGFPRGVSGADLAQRAYQQAWVFGTEMLLVREVSAVRAEAGGHVLTVSGGGEVEAKAVVLAMGVAYRTIDTPGLQELVGAGVYYGAATSEARGLAGGRVFVVGGGNSAGQAAVHLARAGANVRLVVRSPSLATSMSSYLSHEIDATESIHIDYETSVVGGGGEGGLEWLVLADGTGAESRVDAEALFILIGARPHSDWLGSAIARDQGGYVLTGTELTEDPPGAELWQLDRAPYPFESSAPGVFAVGDLRHGAVKRVAAAVGQGSVVVSQVHEYLERLAAATGDSGARG